MSGLVIGDGSGSKFRHQHLPTVPCPAWAKHGRFRAVCGVITVTHTFERAASTPEGNNNERNRYSFSPRGRKNFATWGGSALLVARSTSYAAFCLRHGGALPVHSGPCSPTTTAFKQDTAG